ncbi:MAG TPA: enoyl-CoA hydratase/isomerase family protein [Polyangiaceae bacterium]|jgi:enoyl-CoA hydratase/carnithine racemase
MASSLVDYRTEAGVAIVTLDDPPLNAFTHEMMKDLDEAILDARFDNDVHVLVMTGHGDRFFSAGANLKMLSEVDRSFKYYFALHANETLCRLENTPKLVIAAMNGHAMGGGLEIALACDLRIAKKDSGKLGLPQVDLGLMPGAGGTQRAARLIGKSRALSLIAEGATLDYEAAHAIGLVNHVWEAPSRDAFLSQVVDYARKFVPPNKASMAVGKIKRSIQAGMDMGLEQGLALERELLSEVFSSSDAGEGVKAYLQKRKPKFTGS